MDKLQAKMAKEQRRSARKALLSNAIFISLNVTAKLANTIDLSTEGVSVTLESPLEVGQTCAVTFDVPVEENLKQRALISGRVASCVERGKGKYRIGIRFLQVDQTSKEFIRRALEKYLNVPV